MNARPAKRCKRPAYPTRREVAADPALLERHVPEAWKRSARLAAAAAMLAGAGTVALTPGCASGPPAKVAPIFDHGTGRGALGCVMVVPPAFLSEEEALQVISEVLAEQGLTSSGAPPALKGVAFVGHRVNPEAVTYADQFSSARTPLVPDFFDPAKNVAVEFVSEDDYVGLCHGEFHSSVGSYDILDLAHTMSMAVREFSSGLYFAALYDPMVSYNLWDRKDHEDANARWERTKEQSRQLLREQVKDFVDWLKGQGVI